jgi:hypothetical protein
MPIRIRAKPAAGFRRAGIFHPPEWVEYPDDKFTAIELSILKAEPHLMVEESQVTGPALEQTDAPEQARGRGRPRKTS